MLFEVEHTTRFTYSGPVFLEPLTVRLRPRCDLYQRPLRFQMRVEPAAAASSEMTDLEGNAAAQLWFEGLTPSLVVRTSFAVETLRTNPFDYLVVDLAARQLPIAYPELEHAALQRYLTPADGPLVTSFAREAVEASGGEAAPFCLEMASRIARLVEQCSRTQGDPLPSEVTLSRRSGACRDLAVVFIDACRSVGIASRYVSGYQEAEPEEGNRHLHAWAEVYLPGAGWRSYDPSQGLAVADGHVAVAAGPTPAAAAPTQGSFRGSGVTCTLGADLEVRVSPSLVPQDTPPGAETADGQT